MLLRLAKCCVSEPKHSSQKQDVCVQTDRILDSSNQHVNKHLDLQSGAEALGFRNIYHAAASFSLLGFVLLWTVQCQLD